MTVEVDWDRFAELTSEVEDERARQEEKFPQQHLPDVPREILPGSMGLEFLTRLMQGAQAETDRSSEDGTLTWYHILREEFYEAVASTDIENRREELIQVAAVALRWVEDIDSREKRVREVQQRDNGDV